MRYLLSKSSSSSKSCSRKEQYNLPMAFLQMAYSLKQIFWKNESAEGIGSQILFGVV